ncbi:secondary thiamine-phosphate synthase enzyme YjbQ [Geoglobus acetivorans]|uniref:Secondary thiamine-phosphate synthase enzyme n=1 Tax=Geoglobus acetivorans TaxID=565033 RepID=A0A0A7GCE0_GEOAI|nr:hypothetical protein GACE_0648 [Geoglobus acetivorans]
MIIDITTQKREVIIDITDDVKKVVQLENGFAVIYTPHTTTAVIVNEAERGLLDDFIKKLSELVPYMAGYSHDRIDSNADAHIKASILGNSVTIPVVRGELLLGTWQRILFVEFDGPRKRRVYVMTYEAKKG